jgi:muconolactone D-isomerase
MPVDPLTLCRRHRTEKTMEFLTEIITTVPPAAEADFERLFKAESARARELHAAGHLVRLWRPVGQKRSFGLWRAADADELDREVLSTLPLRDWMTITITPLELHPNDPGDPNYPGDPNDPRAR